MRSLTILLLLSCCLYSITSFQYTRKFIIGMFTVIKGHDWHLHDDCLGEEFYNAAKELHQAIKKEDPQEIMKAVKRMCDDFKKTCPYEDFKQLRKDYLVAIHNGSIHKNLKTNLKALARLTNEAAGCKKKTALFFGTYVGKVINIVLYNKVSKDQEHDSKDLEDKNEKSELFLLESDKDNTSNELSFLSEGLAGTEYEGYSMFFDHNKMILFVEGILEGTSKVPFSQNQCNKEMVDFKPKIALSFKQLFEAIRSRRNVIPSVRNLYELFMAEIPPFEHSCHFKRLTASLISLINRVGLAKMFTRISSNPFKAYEALTTIMFAMKSSDFRSAGIGFGRLLNIALNYYTN